jgi:hypothetical protein
MLDGARIFVKPVLNNQSVHDSVRKSDVMSLTNSRLIAASRLQTEKSAKVNNTDDSAQPTTYVPLPGDDEKPLTPEQIIKPVDKRCVLVRICGKYDTSFLTALGL